MRASTLLAALGGACLAAAASAQIVANGDFETGGLPPWIFTPDANGEPVMVATVAVFQGSQMFRVNPGHNGTGPSGGGNLDQRIELQAGNAYTVSGDLYIENLRTGANANGGTIEVMINGQVVHTWTIGQVAALTTVSGPFTVPYTPGAGGTHSLTLRFTRTFRNSTPSIYHWADNIRVAGGPAPCYVNCDGSTGTPLLNVNDFICFQTRFAAAEPYADCDQSTVLNVNDFVCFQAAFAAGCR